MGYTFRLCPARSECTLKIHYGGEWQTEIYSNGKLCWVDIDPKKASLTEIKDIASKPGYQDTQLKFSYRSPTTGALLSVNTNGDAKNMTKNLPDSRCLELYIDGVRKLDEFPTILFWNCRGLDDTSVNMLEVLVAIYEPAVVFLIETRLSSEVIKTVCSDLGFQYACDSPTTRKAAGKPNCVGLAMLLKASINVDYLDKTSNYLDFVITIDSTSKKWRLTGFYGHPKDKPQSWKWLRKLKGINNLPWIIFGDFNEILADNEKSGGAQKDSKKIDAFKKVVKECRLSSLSFEGSIFTWKSNNIKERLDRGLVTKEWRDLFSNPRVLHLTCGDLSDHIPIVIQTDGRKHTIENTEPRADVMVKLFLFTKYLEEQYFNTICRKLTTISNIVNTMHIQQRPGFYFEIARTIAPQVIHATPIIVHDKGTDEVYYDRLVKFKSCLNLHYILWTSIVLHRPSPDDDHQVPQDFPSDCCTQINTNKINLSEHLAQAWNLLPLISVGRMTPQEIINRKTDEQVKNLITMLKDLFPQAIKDKHFDIAIKRSEYKTTCSKFKEKAALVGRAVILFKIITSLIKGGEMASSGLREDIVEGLRNRKRYFVTNDNDDDGGARFERVVISYLKKPLDYLFKTLEWMILDMKLI